jgi:Mitochondrial ribosomal protein subunit L20
LSRCAESLKSTSRRHQSSYRRARSRLNIKPDASFLPSKTETHDHIVYNPPPSAPNVYHTPTIFLPEGDKRRQMHDLATQRDPQLAADATPWSSKQRLPPPVRRPYEKRYHVTEAQMEEMRQLRREDPMTWGVTALAKKFDCSRIFVSFVTEGLSEEKQKQQKMVTEVIKSRWGTKRRVAREDRALRKERWYSNS